MLPADFYRRAFPDFWAMLGTETYAATWAHAMRREDIRSIRDAAAAAWNIMLRAAPVMRALPDQALRDIGIPEAALHICRWADPRIAYSLVTRFDFALSPSGPKVLEVNAETPMFLWESFEVAGCAARALGFADPNAGHRAALGAAIARAVGPDPATRLVVTAYNTWREDWFTAMFAADTASQALGRSVDVVPLHELQIRRGALRDGAGHPIDVVWRMYPLEHMALDAAGPALFALVERGALRLINPPAALLLQNKAALAILWALAADGSWFTADERSIIERLFVPAFLDAPGDGRTYVRKPVLGREGNSVAIIRGDQTLAASAATTYVAQPMVFQRYVPLSTINGATPVVTCFVIDGLPSAIAMRVGSPITDGFAQFVPIGELS